MKKPFVFLLVVLIALSAAACSDKTIHETDNTTETGSDVTDTAAAADGSDFATDEDGFPVLDEALLDLDGDGILEECTMTHGPTSGVFTLVITASVNGTVKFKNTFLLHHAGVSFGEKDGVPQVVMEKTDYQTGKESVEYHRLSVDGGCIVIDGLDPAYEHYWGDAEWNYGFADPG